MVHTSLDAAGMFPAFGIFADLANVVVYAVEGDVVGMGGAALSAIPGIGQGVTADRYGKKGMDAAEAVGKALAKKEGKEAAEAAAKKPKEGSGKDGGYVEGKAKGSGGKKSKEEVEKRTKELEEEGHAPQRHGGEERVSDNQLEDRAVHSKDPATGTEFDAYKKNADGSPALHPPTRNATAFKNDESLVQADDFARKSPQFERNVATAKANGSSYVEPVEVPLKDIYGDTYKENVRGVTRLGSARNPQGSVPTDFTDGNIRAIYRIDNKGNVQTHTVYPIPK